VKGPFIRGGRRILVHWQPVVEYWRSRIFLAQDERENSGRGNEQAQRRGGGNGRES